MSPSKPKTSDVKNSKKTVSNKLNSVKAQLLSIAGTPKRPRREKPLNKRIEILPYGSNLLKNGLPLPSGDSKALRYRLSDEIVDHLKVAVHSATEHQSSQAKFRVPSQIPPRHTSATKRRAKASTPALEGRGRKGSKPTSARSDQDQRQQTGIVSSNEATNTQRFPTEYTPSLVALEEVACSASYIDAVPRFISVWTSPVRLAGSRDYAVEIAQQAATVCQINELVPCIELICKSQGSNTVVSETLDKMWRWVSLVLHSPMIRVQLQVLGGVLLRQHSVEKDYFRKIVLSNAYRKIEQMLRL